MRRALAIRIFRGSAFTPLPALPASLPVPAGVLNGNVAW
jgi:hypothetical protein